MVAQQEITKTLTFAHSPDPDDAYMFYGFEVGAVKVPGYEMKHHLEDIQSLNEKALRGEFEITAVSAHAFAHLTDRYWVLSCGASVGRKYGPMLVARTKQPLDGPSALDLNVNVQEVMEAAKMSVKTGQAIPLPLKKP